MTDAETIAAQIQTLRHIVETRGIEWVLEELERLGYSLRAAQESSTGADLICAACERILEYCGCRSQE